MTYCYKPNIFNYIFAKNFYSPSEGKNNAILRRLTAFKDHHCLFKFNENKIKQNGYALKKFINDSKIDIYLAKKNWLLNEMI
jgi:hypothetical protein